MSYRRIQRTAFLANTETSLVKRCEYAKVFLPLLASGKRVVNVDESSIPFLDFRNHKWGVRGVSNTLASKDLSPKVNMIAALDTSGKVYISLTQVNTDSEIMTSFLCRLATELNREDARWRQSTVLLLDGAKYHKSPETRQTLRMLGCNYVISAPYSYDAAPIELFFAYFKQVQVNPEQEKTGKK